MVCRISARALVVTLLTTAIPGPVVAQEPTPEVARSFQELMTRVDPGMEVSVVDTAGTEVAGDVLSISASSLTLSLDGTQRELREVDVVRVTRPPHGMSRSKGAWIGFGLGSTLALGIGAACAGDSGCPDGVLGVAAVGFFGGPVAGALLAGKTDEELLFQSGGTAQAALTVSVLPVISKKAKGAALSLTW